MNSPGAGGVGPESFFSPGQAERGQAGAGRAAAAGVTAGACPGCAGGAGSQGEAGRGSCAGGACQGCDPLQVEDPWTNWTGNRNTVQPDLVNQGAQSFQNQGMVFAPGAGVPVPPSSGSHGSGSGGGSVGPQPGRVVPPMPVYGYGPPVNGVGVVNPTLQGMNQRPGNVRNPMAGNGLQNVPMQCGSNFDRVTQIQQLLQGLNARELQQVFQNTQRLVDGNHQRFVPDRLGDVPPEFGGGFIPDATGNLPGLGTSQGRSENRDVFSRSEKWLGPSPTVDYSAWKTREDEVLGFTSYVQELVAWASQGSVQFGREIEQSTHWPTSIAWSTLGVDQQSRAVRLSAILKATFGSHGRIAVMIQSFQEGIDIVPGVTLGDPYSSSNLYLGNGFELLRQLSHEFSLRSRTEGLSLRVQLLNRVFQGQDSSDLIRQIELACAKYTRMISTLLGDSVGLAIGDSDMLTMLVRSLPNDVRNYCLMHSGGESYSSYRLAARRFEQQHRLFKDLHLQSRKVVAGLNPATSVAEEEEGEESEGSGDPIVNAALDKDKQGPRCTKCGKRHDVSACSTNMEKVKCYKCGKAGHISVNCRVKTGDKDGSKGSSTGKSGGTNGAPSASKKGVKGSGKGTGKSGGKKGKMFAMVDDSGTWWYSEGWYDDQPVAEEASAELDGQQKQDVLVLSALVSCPDVPCLPCEPCVFDMSLEDGDGLYVEDHSEEFDLCLNSDLTCCCLNSNFHDMHDFGDMWLDRDDLDAGNLEACCCDLKPFVHVGIDSGFELDPIDEKNEPNTHGTHGVLTARESMTECFETEGHVVSKPCEMMLNGIGPGESFWLLDSGASMSVVSRDVLKQFQHSEIQNNVGPLQAANGTSVDLEGSCKLLLQIEVFDRDGNVKPAVIPLDVMVGKTTYPIISVCKLTQQGWDVTFDKDHVRMFHKKSQHEVSDLSFWHDTPWVRVVPYEGNDVALNVSPVVASSFSKGDTVCALSADQMVQHRLRGHRPYEPTCEVCQSCRGVTKHSRKKTPKGTEFEIHADFGFLNKDFEWVPESEDSERGNVKFLVIRESYSSSIGCVLMTGDRQRDNRQLQKWLLEMGLGGSKDQHSLRVVTDAESSVGNFISSAGLPMGVVVERAPPQGHQANGTAERTIREIKEGLKTLQLDFQRMGYTLVFSSPVFQCCMNYICFSHNNFTTVQQSSRTPRDLVIGDRARNHVFALFGCKVLAELPESIMSKNPNLPRFVEGVYLHPEFSSMGVWVSARIRIGSEMVYQRFVAKSIKLCMPVEILDGHGLFVRLVDERSGLPEAPRSSQEVSVPLPSDLKCPSTGPPVKWLDEHGVSLTCSACKEIEIRGTRGNKNHSRECMERYEKWIRSELEQGQGSGPSESKPTVLQEVKREGSNREVSDLDGLGSVPVRRQDALDSFEELDPLSFGPQDDGLTGETAKVKIEPTIESQEPVDVNLGNGEGDTSQVGSSSQSGDVSRSHPKASVGVKRKWSEEDLLIERRGLKREPDVELADLDREVRDDNKRIDVKPDVAGLVSGLTCDSSLSETPVNDLHEVYALAFLTTDSDDLICHLPLASLKLTRMPPVLLSRLATSVFGSGVLVAPLMIQHWRSCLVI